MYLFKIHLNFIETVTITLFWTNAIDSPLNSNNHLQITIKYHHKITIFTQISIFAKIYAFLQIPQSLWNNLIESLHFNWCFHSNNPLILIKNLAQFFGFFGLLLSKWIISSIDPMIIIFEWQFFTHWVCDALEFDSWTIDLLLCIKNNMILLYCNKYIKMISNVYPYLQWYWNTICAFSLDGRLWFGIWKKWGNIIVNSVITQLLHMEWNDWQLQE